ncbi:enhanced intracellular survival protein Eis [Brachybacterium sp. YJGR34]|uniref:GNAT family N-acetyltransferase n=1 Tax=Brachybacterium sp. YJGR34 TaxID=2059911 RepID=UPI000E0B55A7|nr:GNAT family N-acetyltransferase [Brachybacterium sp. YJGR34]
MPVRDLLSADLHAYGMLTSQAFGGSFDPGAVPSELSPGVTALGIDSAPLPGGQEGVLAAAAEIRHDRIALGGGTAGCGGIGGLAVHPAHRGDGLFRELLTAVIARCDAEDLPLSMLYPSNPAIYRALGYQVVARVESLVVPLVDLQRIRAVPGRRPVPVTEATMPRLRDLHHRLSAEDNGMLRREGPLFGTGMPGGGWAAMLLEDEHGTDRGYLSWTRRSGAADGIGLEVHELMGTDREDRLALLRSLGSWSTVTERVRLRLRTEDPVLDALPGGGARPDTGPVPLVMMRVIDTAGALRSRPAPPGSRGAVRLVVEDGTVPAGTCRAAGTYLVSAADGRIDVEEGTADAGGALLGEIRVDVHAASLLLAGGRTLADARRLGLAASADPAAEGFFDALLAGPRPSVMDSF